MSLPLPMSLPWRRSPPLPSRLPVRSRARNSSLRPPLPAAARAYAPTTTPVAPPRPVGINPPPLQLSNVRPVTATTTPSAMRWSIGAPSADGKVLRPPANVDVTSSIAKLPEPAVETKPTAPAKPVAVANSVAVAKAEAATTTAIAKAEKPAVEKAEAKPRRAGRFWQMGHPARRHR